MINSLLKHPIKIYKEEKTFDEYNSPIVNKVLLYSIKSSVKNVNFDEVINNNEMFNTKVIIFGIRFRSNIDENCIVEYNGNNFNIIGVDILGRNREMKLKAAKINE